MAAMRALPSATPKRVQLYEQHLLEQTKKLPFYFGSRAEICLDSELQPQANPLAQLRPAQR